MQPESFSGRSSLPEPETVGAKVEFGCFAAMRAEVRKTDTGNSRLAAIVARSQTLARRVSRAMDEVRSCHLDDAFLATEKGMSYRCDEDPPKKRD